jgi:hypothetical protein
MLAVGLDILNDKAMKAIDKRKVLINVNRGKGTDY